MRFPVHVPAAYGLAAFAGLALAVAYPTPGWSGLAWVAPGILLLSGAGRPGASAFRLGYLGGLFFQLTCLRWLLAIPFPAGAVAGWLGLSAYLALYQATWLWLCWRMVPSPSSAAPAGDLSPSSGGWLPGWGLRAWPGAAGWGADWLRGVDDLLACPWWRRAVWGLFCAATWVGLEMVQGRFLSGFPWNPVGVSQYRLVPVIQMAAYTGVYGVSFLVVWVGVSLGLSLLRVLRQPSARWGFMAELRLPLLVTLGISALGILRLPPPTPAEREVRLALVQPSIPQTLIWDPREDSNRFARILELSRLAVATQPDLLVWPESSVPSFTEANWEAITGLVRSNGVWMVFGADDAEPSVSRPGEYDHYNAAFLLTPQGRLRAAYRKQHLVIFGEYLPFSRQWPFLQRLIPVGEGFQRGRGPVVFALDAPACRMGVLICFEDIFPGLARTQAALGLDFLLNLTNNGWFGEGAAQWQHAAAAAFRAVENGLPLVRCTNNGLTCWFDEAGRLRQWLGEDSGRVHAPGFLTVRLLLPAAGTRRGPTFYQEQGDVFGWSCLLLTAGAGLAAVPRRSRRVRPALH